MSFVAAKPNAMPQQNFARSVVVPLTALVVAAILLVLAFVIVTARRQDSEALHLSIRLAETALATKKENVARNLKDYAFWQDAFENLHVKVNTAWAATDGNVGANIFNSLGYETAFVVNPAHQTVYAIQEGKPVEIDAMAALPGIAALLPEAVKGGPAAVGFMRMGGDIVVAGASAILPSNPDDAPPPEGRSVMVFVDRLDSQLLAQISHNYLLRDLRITLDGLSDGSASLPLATVKGDRLGNLVWTPDRPGIKVMRSVLPPLGGVLIGMLAFAVIVLRNARRSANALQDSADTIKAYADTLAASEARFRDVAEASSDWIWETDADLRLTFVSDRIAAATGFSAADLIGTALPEFFSSDSATDGWIQLRGHANSHDNFRDLRCSYVDNSGQRRICRVAGRTIAASDGTFLGYRGTASDVTTGVEAQERANHLALHDPLTGLPNRTFLKERLNVALGDQGQDRSRVAVLCLDLDHFKDVNDTLGHAAGDVLLLQLARRLQKRIRGTDTVARLGGDEFAIVQVGVGQPGHAEALCRALLDDFKAPFLVEGSELFIGVSIGVALSPEDGLTHDVLLRHADLALYRAKQAGRSTFRFFETAMDTELQAKKQLEQDLRRALAKDELQLHYQPLVSLTGDSLMGVEALLRWPHPARGMIPPGDFIPLAEETGMIVALGEWVLRTACAQAIQWPGLMMAVNVSAVQFKHREFVDTVRQTLNESGLEPERLELEITEGVLLHDTEAALVTLMQLKEIGVRIAMDDFGTGYSSLGYLNSFPFDKIKIDRSFINQVADADKSSAIVRSVITLGQSLSMVTIAEGVETPEQLAFLRQEGCDQVQGYLFGAPVSSVEFTAVLSNRDGRERGYTYDPTIMKTRLPLAPAAASPLLLPSPPVPLASATKKRVSGRKSVSASQSRNLHRGLTFAQHRGRSLNLLLTLDFAPSELNGANQAFTAFRDALPRWCGSELAQEHDPGWFAAWVSQEKPDGSGARYQVMLHCPSADIRRHLGRAARKWARKAGGRIALDSVSMAPAPRHGETGRGRPNLVLEAIALPVDGSAAQGLHHCGLSASLDRPARAQWRRADRMTANLRRAAAALRLAADKDAAQTLANSSKRAHRAA